jgi:hypothetical protein
MKRVIPLFTFYFLLSTFSLPAQTARLGSLPADTMIITNETDAAALAALHATNAVLRAAITNEAALRAAGDAAGMAALYGTNAVLRAAITNEAALREAHTNDTANPHGVTAAQIGALTAEQDLAALRAYHYGSPDIVESPAEWFVFNGAGTITGFNWEAGRENVVIPWAIGGVPVTAIGDGAFEGSGIVSVIAPQTVKTIGDAAFDYCYSLASVLLPQAQTVGVYAFDYCYSLASVSLPQAQTIGDGAFIYCDALTSVSLPQATTIGIAAFYYCTSLTSINLPQATAIGNSAFIGCTSLTSVRMGQNAPPEATEVFYGITPPPTVYVTNPQATGWGAVWNGAPVVRPPLYGSNVTAQAFTLAGDTITEWPVGGGETSIIAPLIASGTNVTVTSTQSVYSVAVTGAGPVGIDWSGLALDGTGRAEVTLRLNVTEWGGTNVTFSPSLTFDRTPEILVTGVWEFAASTIDGVTTRVRQTWPETHEWTIASYAYAASRWVASLQRLDVSNTSTNSLMCVCPPAPLLLIRPGMSVNANKPTSFSYGFSTYFIPQTSVPTVVYGPFSVTHGYRVEATHAVENPSRYGLVQIWVGNTSPVDIAQVMVYPSGTSIRPANANERAAYEAGWRP